MGKCCYRFTRKDRVGVEPDDYLTLGLFPPEVEGLGLTAIYLLKDRNLRMCTKYLF